jgi:hypothetical protein
MVIRPENVEMIIDDNTNNSSWSKPGWARFVWAQSQVSQDQRRKVQAVKAAKTAQA